MNKNKLNEISVPSSVTEIGNYAFAGCKYLKKVIKVALYVINIDFSLLNIHM